MRTTLKGLRGNLDLTQKEIAEKVGVSEDTWRNYEKFKTFPDIPVIENILKLTGVSYDDINFLPLDYGLTVKKKKTLKTG